MIVALTTLTSLSAQTAASTNSSSILNNSSFTELKANDWSFYVDDESKVYYIDFEAINVNINDIVVTDSKGDVVLKENVLDLPVNTIYEIDFSVYGKGSYKVELRSFTSVIRKEVQIRWKQPLTIQFFPDSFLSSILSSGLAPKQISN